MVSLQTGGILEWRGKKWLVRDTRTLNEYKRWEAMLWGGYMDGSKGLVVYLVDYDDVGRYPDRKWFDFPVRCVFAKRLLDAVNLDRHPEEDFRRRQRLER